LAVVEAVINFITDMARELCDFACTFFHMSSYFVES